MKKIKVLIIDDSALVRRILSIGLSRDPQIEVVATASKSIMNRPVTKQEQRVMMKYLKQRKDRREAAIIQVVWALLTSSEVRFNY